MQQKSQNEINSSFTIDIIRDTVYICPKKEHQYTLIFLTGLDHHPTLFFQLFLTQPFISRLETFKIIIPRPPSRPTTILQGREVLSWFDIYERGPDSFLKPNDESFNIKHIEESKQMIEVIIQQELKLLKSEQNLFIGGFSQGCALTLYISFSLNIKLGGVIAIAGYLFDQTPFIQKPNFPYRVFHGLSDKIRPWESVKISYEKRNCPVTLIEGMDHEFRNRALRQEIVKFLDEILNQFSSKL